MNDQWRPVQIIFAGKAHPADDPGKRVLQRVFNFARDQRFGGRIAFVEDYGEQVAQYLVHGVDAWLNNPLPPMEACGTSGMKASLNGVPQLSILDGWWPEGFNGKNGWAFGGQEADNRDPEDAEAIYRLLEEKLVPAFYNTDEDGSAPGMARLHEGRHAKHFPHLQRPPHGEGVLHEILSGGAENFGRGQVSQDRGHRVFLRVLILFWRP